MNNGQPINGGGVRAHIGGGTCNFRGGGGSGGNRPQYTVATPDL